MASKLTPHFADVQAHCDLSDDFFRLFLDPSQTYSCAYFERDDMTLEQAQMAKIDLALGKLGLTPGMTLLDIGCGWGAAMRRAVETHDVNVIGLTLSKNQATHVEHLLDDMDTGRSRRVLLQGWEQFDEPVDRIVSIGAFEHFGHDRYPAFFRMAYDALPPDGVMLLHTICGLDPRYATPPLPSGLTGFIEFITTEISRAPGYRQRRWCVSTPPRRDSGSPGCNPCNPTTRQPWTTGPRRSKHTATKPSPSNQSRSTTAT
ncbi:cyclopropane mycolic acid synthase family methyltransferase [Mycolicibacterium aubagnense]